MTATRSGVGRPREFDEEAVLDAAVEIFWARGYAATTTRALEAELGLTQSSIYNAFGSKAGLMNAALDRYEARLERELVAPLVAAGGGLGALDRFVGSIVAWVHDGDRRGCMLLNALSDGAPDERIVARAGRYRDQLRAIFLTAFLADGHPHDIAGERAEALLAGVMGINITARGGAEIDELERLATGLRHQLVAA